MTNKMAAGSGGGNAYSWYVCGVLTLLFAFNFMDRSLIAVVVEPIKQSFAISDTMIGVLQGAAFAIFYCLFMYPLARIADHRNRRNLLIIAVVIWCSATVWCGLAQTVPQLFMGRILTAIGEAAAVPCAISLLSDYFDPSRRTRAISIWSTGVYLGAALSLGGGGAILKALGGGTVSVPLLGELEAWRIVFITMGGAGCILVPLLLAVKEPERRNDTGDAAEAPYSMRQVLAVFKKNLYPLCAVIGGFSAVSVAGQSIQAWAPTLFVRQHGWSGGDAGIWLGLLAISFGPIGAVAGGLVTDRVMRRRPGDAKVVVGGVCAALSIIACITLTVEIATLAVASIATLNFLIGASFGLAKTALIEIVPNRMRAQTVGIYSLVGQLFVATMGPLTIGVFNDYVFQDDAKIAWSMRIVLGISFVIAALLLLGGRHAVRQAYATRRAVAA
ncbi:MFS transporter [Alloalcanivorax marinus]|uniref:MFS transporter n=1 Tax=Alloalcanivorax marinus TaxID=1177169 RepID=UPI001934428D|nr:MFS transporter [Alloalcanivorax marinus]MBL7250409.1 MFS transporter [Alloalcanivorax marinus]